MIYSLYLYYTFGPTKMEQFCSDMYLEPVSGMFYWLADFVFQSWSSFFWEPSEWWGWGKGLVPVSLLIFFFILPYLLQTRVQISQINLVGGEIITWAVCVLLIFFFFKWQLLGTSFGQWCWSINGQFKGLQRCSLCSLPWQQTEPGAGKSAVLIWDHQTSWHTLISQVRD